MALNDLANACYDLLPYSGKPEWKSHVSVQSICKKLNVSSYWQPGSKLPALTALFDNLEACQAGSFQKLVVEIVTASIGYRTKKGDPLKATELDQINDAVLRLGYKIPELWDASFRQALVEDTPSYQQERLAKVASRIDVERHAVAEKSVKIVQLRDQLSALHSKANRQEAGIQFQGLLNELFTISGLKPKRPYRVIGEEIDGSFELEGETYVIEAKWEAKPLREGPLLKFYGVVTAKSTFTRGLYISLSGYTAEAQKAIVMGKQPCFFAMDGFDLMQILNEDIDLVDFLRARIRLLAERGAMFVPYPKTKEEADRCN